MTNKFCPIMLIGMPPPKENEVDTRLCVPYCKWYDELEEECVLNLIKNSLDYQNALVEYEHGYETVTEDSYDGTDPFSYSEDYRC